MTEAGLNTVNLSQMNTFQQVLLFLHIMAGSAIFVSAFVVLVRKRAFETRFRTIIRAHQERMKEERREHRRSLSGGRLSRSSTGLFHPRSGVAGRAGGDEDVIEMMPNPSEFVKKEDEGKTSKENAGCGIAQERAIGGSHQRFGEAPDRVRFSQDAQVRRRPSHGIDRSTSDALSALARRRAQISSFATSMSAQYDAKDHASGTKDWDHHSFITSAVVGRNSQFHGLTREEREQLGGVEYRAIKLLAYIVPAYYVLWQLIGCLGIGAYMAYNKPSVARENGLNPW